MKTIKYFYFLFLLLACSKEQTNNEITIKGHLNNSDIKEIILTSNNLTYSAQVDSNGFFFLKINSDYPRAFSLNDKYHVYLIPGDSIIISNSENDFIFSGGQSAVLSTYWKEYYSTTWDSINIKDYYNQEPAEFKKDIRAFIDQDNSYLAMLKDMEKDVNQAFLSYEENRIKFYWLWELLEYSKYYRQYHGKNLDVNISYYDDIKNEVNLNDTNLLLLRDYKEFLYTYVLVIPKKLMEEKSEKLKDVYSETDFLIDFMRDEFKDKKVLDYILFRTIYDRTNELDVDTNNFKKFKHYCTNVDYVDKVYKNLTELKSLAPGNPAPDFTFYDSLNNKYNLSSFKGKFLLIDIWTPYCTTCLQEMPYFHDIEEEYKNENIAFITVCLEKKNDLWLKRINDLELGGLQLIDKDGWNSQFRIANKIPWTPIYMLIDKEGNYIDARAPRPSGNLRELLDKTLKNEI